MKLVKKTISIFSAAILGGVMGTAIADESSPEIVYECNDPTIPLEILKCDNPTIQLEILGTYRGNLYNSNSSIEPAVYDPFTKRLFVINQPGVDAPRGVAVLDIHDPSAPTKTHFIDVSDYGLASTLAVNHRILAVGIESTDATKHGYVAFFNTSNFKLIAEPVKVGVQPAMVAFTPNGRQVVVVSTGEASDDEDPVGSVSMINIQRRGYRLKTSVTTDDFSDFEDQRDELIESGVRIFAESVSQDLEPEAVAVSHDSRTAYVTLTPNNAFAVVDIKAAKVVKILPFGYKDHSVLGNGLDASNEDEQINITNWPVRGMYQPDILAIYRARGQTYLVTPNEGAERDDDERIEDLFKELGKDLDEDVFPNRRFLQMSANLGRLKVTKLQGDTDGDGDFDELYSFGARSFSIWTTDGDLVFDSGDGFEQITAAAIPDFFNAEDNTDDFDSRSDDLGPEPETVTVGRIGPREYAFVTLEQIGGVMVYDITNPYEPSFEVYVNNRRFGLGLDEDICTADTNISDLPSVCTEAGDLGPEGPLFIPQSSSPINAPLLAITHEISDTTTLYRLSQIK